MSVETNIPKPRPRIRDRVRDLLPSGPFARHATLLGGGTAISQGSAIIVAPILTRLYSPADFAVLGLFVAFVSTAAIAATARYDVAIVSAKESGEAAALTVGALVLSLPVTLLISGGLFALVRAGAMGFAVMPMAAVPIAGFAVLVSATFATLRYWYVRKEAFATISKVTIYQGTVRSATQVGFGLPGWGAFGLLAGEVAGRLVGIGRMAREAFKPLREELRAEKTSIGRVMAKFRDFPLFSLPSSLLDTLALQLPIPLVVLLFGADPAGEFTLVQRLLAVPMSFVAVAIADAFHGRAAAYVRDERAQLRPFFLRTVRTLFLLGIGPLAVVGILGPLTFGWIFGERWARVGTLTAIMVPAALAQLSVSPVSRVVFLLPSGLRLKLFLDLTRLGVVCGILFGCARAGFSFEKTLVCYSAAQIVDYILYFLLMLRFIDLSRVSF